MAQVEWTCNTTGKENSAGIIYATCRTNMTTVFTKTIFNETNAVPSVLSKLVAPQ